MRATTAATSGASAACAGAGWPVGAGAGPGETGLMSTSEGSIANAGLAVGFGVVAFAVGALGPPAFEVACGSSVSAGGVEPFS